MESTLQTMIKKIEEDYPDVAIYEVSVEQDLQVKESMMAFGNGLEINREFFVRQRFLGHL